MSADQLQAYCNCFSFMRTESIRKHHEIDRGVGSRYNHGWVMWYVKNTKKVRKLAELGNDYAKNDLEIERIKKQDV